MRLRIVISDDPEVVRLRLSEGKFEGIKAGGLFPTKMALSLVVRISGRLRNSRIKSTKRAKIAMVSSKECGEHLG